MMSRGRDKKINDLDLSCPFGGLLGIIHQPSVTSDNGILRLGHVFLDQIDSHCGLNE